MLNEHSATEPHPKPQHVFKELKIKADTWLMPVIPATWKAEIGKTVI
jgi:hypothetical protein